MLNLRKIVCGITFGFLVPLATLAQVGSSQPGSTPPSSTPPPSQSGSTMTPPGLGSTSGPTPPNQPAFNDRQRNFGTSPVAPTNQTGATAGPMPKPTGTNPPCSPSAAGSSTAPCPPPGSFQSNGPQATPPNPASTGSTPPTSTSTDKNFDSSKRSFPPGPCSPNQNTNSGSKPCFSTDQSGSTSTDPSSNSPNSFMKNGPGQRGFQGQFPQASTKPCSPEQMDNGQCPGGKNMPSKNSGAGMLKMMAQRLNQQLVRIKKKVTVIESKGITTPKDVKDAVTAADTLIAKVNSLDQAQEDSDSMDIQGDFGEVQSDLMSVLEVVERLYNLDKIFKRIDKAITQFDRQLAAAKKQTSTSIDLSSAINDFETALTNLKQAYQQAKDQIKSGNAESGFSDLEDKVFDTMPDVAQAAQVISQAKQLTRTVKTTEQSLNQFKLRTKRLKASGSDVSELEKLLVTLASDIAAVKAAAGAKPMNPENLFEALGTMLETARQIKAILNPNQDSENQNNVDQGLEQNFERSKNDFLGGLGERTRQRIIKTPGVRSLNFNKLKK